MTREEIVEHWAKQGVVERLARYACRVQHSQLDDLCAEVYAILLLTSEDKICRMWEEGWSDGFILKVLKNQYFSNSSDYHRMYRRHAQRSTSLQDARDIADDQEMRIRL